ncbi:MAG: ABC transporter substrate-binding protein [Chloroflexi bacterium]|nr:ABC transporter substrate-binding protein [Chloroflexota bacterium]
MLGVKKVVGMVSLLAILALLVSGCAPAAPSTVTKLVVGASVLKDEDFLPLFAAIDKGYWKKRNLEVSASFFGGAADVAQAQAAGSLDIAIIGSVSGAGPIAKGLPAKIVAVSTTGPAFYIIVAKDSPIKTVADLKGKKIGVSRYGSLTDWSVMQVAKAQGWDVEKGIQRVPLGAFKEQVAAFKSKQSDGFVWSLDGALEMEKEGLGKRLVNIADYAKDFLWTVIQPSDKLIKENPTALKGFLEGWFEAAKFIKKNKDYAVDLAVKNMEMDKESAAAAYDVQGARFSEDGTFAMKQIEAVIDSMVELKIVDTKPTAAQLAITQFVPVKVQ